MKRLKKVIGMIIMLVLAMGMTACDKDGTASSSSGGIIHANLAKSELDFTDVTYYDFCTDSLIENYSEQGMYVVGNTLNSTDIVFVDSYNDRIACVSVAIASNPESFVLYKNYLKTYGDTYYIH